METLSLLQTIFFREISVNEKNRILKEKFNIQLADDQREDVCAMNAILESCKAEGILLMCRKIHATWDEAAQQLVELMHMSENDAQEALDKFGYDR